MDAMLLLFKATLLLSATILAARLRRRAPAVTRHRLWTLAFVAVLALPVLAFALPALYVPVPTGWAAPSSLRWPQLTPVSAPNTTSPLGADRRDEPSRALDMTISDATRASRPTRIAERPRSVQMVVSWSNVLALLSAAWLIGTTIAASALSASLLAVRRLSHTSEEIRDQTWRDAADALGARLGLSRRARLLVSAAVSTPMAGGLWSPVIFLPASARGWSAERRDVVLAHEIAHLAGRDPLRHVWARLAVALYWFHPLAWIAARQATAAREQACDEAVLAIGTRPSAYARVLLDFADSMHPVTPVLAALPIVEPSLLETRLMAILNADTQPPIRRKIMVPAIAVALLTLSVAAARPAARASVATTAPPLTVAPTPATLRPATDAFAVQAGVDRDSACWWDTLDGRSFSGSMSSTSSGGRSVIYEQIGTRGADRVIQKSFGDLRLCMLAEDVGDRTTTPRPSQWLGRARRVVLEARRGNAVQRLEVGQQAGGGLRTSWRVGGAERSFDAAAERWRDRMLAVLDTTWDLSMLRGQVSSLRGEISSIRGEESSIRGEISSLRGEVSSMRGRISSIHGEESSLRGEISSIRGHLSSLRGAISSERGTISSLNSSQYRATDAELKQIATSISRHEAEIARIEREIRDYDADKKVASVEREIQALDTNGKVAAIEAQIRGFDLEGKVAAAERRIAGLDVQGKVAAIERQIAALDADRRGRELEERRNAELRQLDAAIAAIR